MTMGAKQNQESGAAVDKMPRHPSFKTGVLFLALGVGGCIFFVWAFVAGGYRPSLLDALFVVGIEALFLWSGAQLLVVGPAVQRINLALGAVERGDLAQAEALLDGLPRRPRPRALTRQTEALQRALIAFQRADVEAMRARLLEAQAIPLPFFGRNHARTSRCGARALEALALALAGDTAGARGGVRDVRASEDSPCDALATASVAEALCLRREGKADELAAQLRRDRDLVGEHGRARERALVRALARALNQAGRTPYREAAEEAGSTSAPLGEWAERLVPGLGAFVAAGRAAKASAPRQAGGNGATSTSAAGATLARRMPPKASTSQTRRTVGLWALLILMFTAVWQLQLPGQTQVKSVSRADDVAFAVEGSPRGEQAALDLDEEPDEAIEAEIGRPPRAQSRLPSMPWWGALFLSLMGFFSVRNHRREKKYRRAFFKAQRDVTSDASVAEGRAAFESLARSKLPLDAAAALLELGRLSAREGDFESTRRHCEAALAKVFGNRAAQVSGYDWLVPEVRALFAYALAALDDAPGAEAELEALRVDHPAYPRFGRTSQQVRQLVALRRGDLTEAACLAASRSPSLSMPWRDELLGDLSLAVDDPAAFGRPALERFGFEVRDDPRLARWLDRTAPALMNAFRRLDAGQPAAAP